MAKAKVMVVEDELILAKGIELLLRRNEYEVCGPVTTGEEAFALARAQRPDLVLMDISLAGTMDGVATADIIRRELDVPAIFLTAYGDRSTIERACAAEPYSYLLKPFEDTELLIAVEVVLAKDRVQRLVRERERWLGAVLRGIEDGVLSFNSSERVEFINRAGEEITGWAASEAVGRSAWEVLGIMGAGSPEGAARMEQWTPLFPPGGGEARTIKARTGQRVPVEGSCSPVTDERGEAAGHVCVFRDISVRRAAEERLAGTLADLRAVNARVEQKSALLQAIFESMPCGVMAVDQSGTVRAVNAFLECLMGIRGEEVLGRPMGSLFGCSSVRLGDKPCDGLGCSQWCAFRKCAEEAFQNQAVQRVEVDHEVGTGGHGRTLRLSISAATGQMEGETLAFLLVEDRTEIDTLRRILRAEASFAGIVAKDGKMRDLFDTIQEVADGSVPVLIQGESGTGKELVAMAIHSQGLRANQRFVAVNCGALPDGLLESELFGHVKGAFTGAVRDKKGRFELADGGTLFLDEVGELSTAMQVKLLRVLQTGRFERVGGEKTVQVDVRIISATNKTLQREVAEGRFRGDLFYRLCVVPITVPPLRERRGDIPLLVDHILGRIARARGRGEVRISPEAIVPILDHSWPGNVRELENVLQYALIKSKGETIEPRHLPASVMQEPDEEAMRPPRRPLLTADRVAGALRATGGNRVQAAKQLGVSRATLYRFLGDEFGGAQGRGPAEELS
jgi:PAS domain S-box-containing protein